MSAETDLEVALDGYDVEALAAECVRVAAQRADLDAWNKRLRRELCARLGLGRHRAGPLAVSIREQRRFSAEQAQLVLDADRLDAITIPAIDRKLAEHLLSPAEYAACQKVGDPIVTVT